MNTPRHILIADNRHPIRQGLKALLAQYPQVNVVGEAADGREAVAMVAVHRPDVVLMDMQMPEMDGLEATRRIKTDWPQTRVVALSMYHGYKAEAFQAGVDAYLLKGCPPDYLLDAILDRERLPVEVR